MLKIARHLTTVSSSLAQVTYETSQVLLVDGQVICLRDLPFLPHLMTDSSQNVLPIQDWKFVSDKLLEPRRSYLVETFLRFMILNFDLCSGRHYYTALSRTILLINLNILGKSYNIYFFSMTWQQWGKTDKNKSGHEKTCLIPYANNYAVWSAPLLFTA